MGTINPDGPQPSAPMTGPSGGGDMLGSLLMAGAQIGTSIYLQRRQEKHNMALAKYQTEANERYLRQQLEYNTPANQMRRYQEAGLNPNLIYGNGSSSAGNQSAPLSHPGIQPVDYQRLMNAIPLINQTRLVTSQVQANDAKIRQSGTVAALNELQAKVVEKNPLLNDEGFKAIIESLKSAADVKASEAGIRKNDLQVSGATMGMQAEKMFREIQLLDQRFNLGNQDAQIKAQVLKSKEFQNAILEVQKRFMTDGDMTPQHILQFASLLLMKVL